MVRSKKFAMGIFLLGMVLPHLANAQYETSLTVIADYGGEPVVLALAEIVGPSKAQAEFALRQDAIKGGRGELTAEVMLAKLKPQFPLVSQVKPGRFQGKDFAQRKEEIYQPFVMVGDDHYSQRWLAGYAPKLKELGAYVAVVSAKSEESAMRMSRIYGDGIVFLNLDEFMQKYQIPALPALLTADGVYQ